MSGLPENIKWTPTFNLNKIFPFLSIRKKLIIAFTLLSCIPLIVIGLFGIYNNIHNMQMFAYENLVHDVEMINERAEKFLVGVQEDIYYLTQSPLFQEYSSQLQTHNHPLSRGIKNLLTHL